MTKKNDNTKCKLKHLEVDPNEKVTRDMYVKNSDPELDRYLKSLCGFDLVTTSEAKELVKKANTSENKEEAKASREKMITANIRLVVKCAIDFKRKHRSSLDIQDLAEEGIVGLMKSIGRYDPDHESKAVFSTYSVPYIKAEMFKAYQKNRFIRIPSNRFEAMNFIYKLRARYLESDKELTNSIIMKELNCSKRHLNDILTNMKDDVVKLEELVTLKEDGDCSWESFIEDRKSISPSERISSKNTMEYLDRVMSEVLTDQEQVVMWNLYLTSEALKLGDIGILLGVSRERVRQVKAVALRKMKEYFEEEGNEEGREIFMGLSERERGELS